MKKKLEIEADIQARMKEKYDKEMWEIVSAKRAAEDKAKIFENNYKKLYNESIEWS